MEGIQIFLLLSLLPLHAGLYKFFEKSGEKGWKALVPVYGHYVWIKILKNPWWWIILTMIPTVSFFMMAILLVQTANHLNKRNFTDHVLIVLGYFIFLPLWTFDSKIKYVGPPKANVNRNWLKEWGEAAVFAIVAATLIRTFFFEAFTIPTGSMENSLKVGDYLFVNKMRYGAKVPAVPLTFPFTHNTLPGTKSTPSYLEWVKLPYLRFPGYDHVKNNDIVVFNFPEGDTVLIGRTDQSYYQIVRDSSLRGGLSESVIRKGLIETEQLLYRPVDKEDNYVKRCVAIPGDKLEIKDNVLFINGQKAYEPPNMQLTYYVPSPSISREEILDAGAGSVYPEMPNAPAPYYVSASKTVMENIKGQLGAYMVGGPADSTGIYDPSVFPHDKRYKWNRANFGPLVVPKKGVTVKIDTSNISLYRRIIEVYEGHKLQINGANIVIDGQNATSYTFALDYYFMMGDNRHNSLDSRFWGYVPETHIIGSPSMIWFSKGDYDGIRFDRMFTGVYNDGLSTTFRIIFLVSVAVLWGGYELLKRRKKTAKKADAK